MKGPFDFSLDGNAAKSQEYKNDRDGGDSDGKFCRVRGEDDNQ